MKTYKAFNKNLTPEEWVKEPECQVPLATLRGRLALGRSIEDALTLSLDNRRARYAAMGERPRNKPKEVFEAFGLSLTIPEWSEKTGFSKESIRWGKNRKEGLEKYLTWRVGSEIFSVGFGDFAKHRQGCIRCLGSSRQRRDFCFDGETLHTQAIEAWVKAIREDDDQLSGKDG